jgi:hypothetical protein
VPTAIESRFTNDSRQGLVDTFHEFEVEVLSLASVPLASLGEFGIRFGSEPNDHVS